MRCTRRWQGCTSLYIVSFAVHHPIRCALTSDEPAWASSPRFTASELIRACSWRTTLPSCPRAGDEVRSRCWRDHAGVTRVRRAIVGGAHHAQSQGVVTSRGTRGCEPVRRAVRQPRGQVHVAQLGIDALCDHDAAQRARLGSIADGKSLRQRCAVPHRRVAQ